MTPKGIVFAINKHTNETCLSVMDSYVDARNWADKFYFDSCAFEISIHEVDIDDTPTDEEWASFRRYTEAILDLLQKVRKWEILVKMGTLDKPPVGKHAKVTNYDDYMQEQLDA